MKIPIVREEGAKTPVYATPGSSGADIHAFIKSPLTILPGTSALIPSGNRVAIPEGYEIQVRPRSGLALKNMITVLNGPGTVDSSYRGDIGVILINHGTEPFTVDPGMRIAQLVLAKVELAEFEDRVFLDDTLRGEGGFGHSGV